MSAISRAGQDAQPIKSLKKRRKDKIKKKEPITKVPCEQLRNGFFKKVPRIVGKQNDMIEEMYEWLVNNPTKVMLEDFPLEKRMSPRRFFNIAKTNEYFAEGLEMCRDLISSRINNLWIAKTVDGRFADRWLPIHHKEYKEEMRQRSAEKSAQAESKVIQTVVYDRVPNDPRVPEKE